ncbi:phage terminase small subunit [Acinetobacter celticus]|uniref:Terminase n=1 Tax=Acinetobacter celticus TaxID=1891224 RepID=A0A1C3CUP1_9GAMM|nr:phage terminase small subunit [Acinetobacter celticus]ODA12427.1 terminase [Acinetobacter celticus]
MLSPARRHRLAVKAALEAAKADEFGGVRPDASVYQLQLTELKNDTHVLRSIQSQTERAKVKAEQLIPKHMPYVNGVIESGFKVDQDEVITTIMIWCFDSALFDVGLKLAEYALKHNLKMPDSYSRNTATIIAEEIGNAARVAHKAGDDFQLEVLEKAHHITTDFDMPDEVRAKILLAIGRAYLHRELATLAVAYLKAAVEKHENCGGKQDLQKAERLFKKQAEEQLKNLPEPMLNADGSQVVDDQGNLAFHPT